MKILIILIYIFLPGIVLQAQTVDVRVTDVKTELTMDSMLQVSMNLILPPDLEIKSARMMTFTPVLKEGNNEQVLPLVYVYGRKREIVNKRNNHLPLEGSTVIRRIHHTEQVVSYKTTIACEPWMRDAEIILEENLCGCGNKTEGNSEQLLAKVSLPAPPAAAPLPLVVKVEPQPVKEEKTYTLHGKAFIDFPVNKTDIYTDYRKNPIELARVDSTLESLNIKNIRRIHLHGYASPEGPYPHNAMLAQKRTEALKKYIMDKYGLDESIFVLESTPEDWEGLIKLAEACDWPEKERILEIAHSDAQPDQKEARLRSLGNTYQRISKNWFPVLRHTDYRIEYIVKEVITVYE